MRVYIQSSLLKQGYGSIQAENIEFKIEDSGITGKPLPISSFLPGAQSDDEITLKQLVDTGAWALSII
jgi:hypothetical protein